MDLGPNPEEACVTKERSWILLEVLADMPERYQRAIKICDVEGVDPKRAAKRLGMPLIPVIPVSHLSEAEKRAFIVADNKLAEQHHIPLAGSFHRSRL